MSGTRDAYWCVIARINGSDIEQRFVRTRRDASIAADQLRRQHAAAVILMKCTRPVRPGEPTRWQFDGRQFEVAAREPERSTETLF